MIPMIPDTETFKPVSFSIPANTTKSYTVASLSRFIMFGYGVQKACFAIQSNATANGTMVMYELSTRPQDSQVSFDIATRNILTITNNSAGQVDIYALIFVGSITEPAST